MVGSSSPLPSYDGWTVAMWEQYIRDLAVFGANVAIVPWIQIFADAMGWRG